jgi:adenylyl-sulfate kinase
LTRPPSTPSAGLHAVAIWLTGLPCAGKTTIAGLVAEGVRAAGETPCILDGDALRAAGSRDLGFSAADRHEQSRRAARAALAALARGEVPIVATVSPYRAARAQARAIIGAERFLEVHVDAPTAICEGRDVRGLYARARAGEVQAFTGVSDPYEPPDSPALRLDTAQETPEASVARVLALLGLRERTGAVAGDGARR